jgi:hypothetical protein
MLAAAFPEHREDGADGFLEHFLPGFHVLPGFHAAAERREFGGRRANPRSGSRLALTVRMVSFAAVSRASVHDLLSTETPCPLLRRIRIPR